MKTIKNNNYNYELKIFLKKLNIFHPKNLSIYIEALTHKTYANEHNLNYNYERLEFLGDSAINWVVTNFLYKSDKSNEGSLSLTRSNLVKKQTLASCCRQIGLNKFILFGNGAKNNISNESIYEDVFEAFMGAIAQDQGIKKVIQIIQSTLIKNYHSNIEKFTNKDYKTQLQEILQAKGINLPEYTKITTNYSKLKKVKVVFNGCTYGEGEGNSFNEAEQNAAKNALDKMIKK